MICVDLCSIHQGMKKSRKKHVCEASKRAGGWVDGRSPVWVLYNPE